MQVDDFTGRCDLVVKGRAAFGHVKRFDAEHLGCEAHGPVHALRGDLEPVQAPFGISSGKRQDLGLAVGAGADEVAGVNVQAEEIGRPRDPFHIARLDPRGIGARIAQKGLGIMAEEYRPHQLAVGPLVFGAGGGDVGVGFGDRDRRRGQVVVYQAHDRAGRTERSAPPRHRAHARAGRGDRPGSVGRQSTRRPGAK